MTTFKPTYLYIKQHTKTGKLYFGKTTKNDVEKYLGSGNHWRRHYNYHGREYVVTLWYCLFYDKEECNKFALMFSKQENIVQSKEWLNQIFETGLDRYQNGKSGYKHSEETKCKIGEKNKVSVKKYFESDEGKEQAKNHSIKRLGTKMSNDFCKHQSESLKKSWNNGIRVFKEEHKDRLRTINIGRKCSPERVEQLSNNFKGKHHTEETKRMMSERAKTDGRVMPTTKGILYEIVTCPHCNLEGKGGAMKRYHFDNCKNNRNK